MCGQYRLFSLLGIVACLLLPLAAFGDESDEKEAAAAAEPETPPENPHLLGDAPPDELLGGIAILRVKERRLPGTTREEKVAELVKMQEAIIDAADRVLNSDQADETQAAKALAEKLLSLTLEKRLSQPNAIERLQQAIRERLDDKRGKVASEARLANSKQQLEELADLTPEQRETLCTQIMTELDARGMSRDMLNVGLDIARRLESVDPKLGARAYREMVAMLNKSDDEKLREYIAKFEGSARRAELPGQFMQLEGTTVDGKPFDWASYRGKVVLVDFWATWCGPCIAELPNVKKNYELYHDKGFDVIGISLDDDRQQLEEFLAKEQLPWTTLFSDDPQATGWEHPLATYYGIMAIPSVLLVDQGGKVVHIRARGQVLGEELARLLGPPPAQEPEPAAESEAE